MVLERKSLFFDSFDYVKSFNLFCGPRDSRFCESNVFLMIFIFSFHQILKKVMDFLSFLL